MVSENLWGCESISQKTIVIFPNNLFDFRSDDIEKQINIQFSSYNSKI